MRFTKLAISGVVLIEPDVHFDERGLFMEVWRADKFAEAGITATFVQENHSRSKKGTLRGLHFQNPHPQGKLIRVTEGEIFDVAVDLRASSPTFGKWVGTLLSGKNRNQLWIPEGFAHGFLVMSDIAECIYKCTDVYHPESEHIITWNDGTIGVMWPGLNHTSPVVSHRDTSGSRLQEVTGFP